MSWATPSPRLLTASSITSRSRSKRPGCQVRTQPGYFNPKPFRNYTDLEKDIHLFDLAPNEKSEFQAPKSLPITALTYDVGQGTRVRGLARIPQGLRGRLGGQTAEIVALFFDAKDDLMSLQRVALTRADYAGKSSFSAPGRRPSRGPLMPGRPQRPRHGQSAVASTTIYCGPTNRQACPCSPPASRRGRRALSHRRRRQGSCREPAVARPVSLRFGSTRPLSATSR